MKFILLFLACLSMVGCASNGSSTSTSSSSEPVSSIPWNKPQKWEGGGALGGMAGQ